MMETVYFNFIFGAHTGKPGPETLEGPKRDPTKTGKPGLYQNPTKIGKPGP